MNEDYIINDVGDNEEIDWGDDDEEDDFEIPLELPDIETEIDEW